MVVETKLKSSLNSPVFSIANKLVRLCWFFVFFVFFRCSPVSFFSYRRFILKIFRAKVDKTSRVYPTAKIWLPSNLFLDSGCTIGPDVKVYNQGEITIGANSIISQGAHLCASTHDYNDPLHPLILAPIKISDNVWICADAFVGPGVTVAEGSVIGARCVVHKDTESWSVYSGNPAVKIKERRNFSND